MGRKPKNSTNELDQLLLDAQRSRSDKSGTSLPMVSISKPIMEFAQSYKAITYREKRAILSAMAKSRQLEANFCKLASTKLPFKPDNWSFFVIKGRQDFTLPWLIPETLETGRGLVGRPEELQDLIKQDAEVCAIYEAFKESFRETDRLTEAPSSWIHEQFKNGSLESKIISFKNRGANRKKTMISKGFVSNLIAPSKADVVKKTGELPDLSVGERQALQFLLGKLQNMTDREKYLKKRLLEDEEEDPKKHGFFVVFEQTEALRQSYGDIHFDGYHYKNLEQSLGDLLEKKRKLLIETEKDTLELSLTLIQKLEMRHKFHEDPEFRSYVAVRIPYDVAKLHDKKYTSYPEDHFALLRTTPPKTLLDKPEVRFFDFLRDEAPHKKNATKTVRRIKRPFLELIGGAEWAEHRNTAKLADRIESIYVLKAINMGLLKSGSTEVNSDGDEVYVFEYVPKSK